MVTPQQVLDAMLHADEWPDELLRLRQENAELRRQLETERAHGNRMQSNYEFYLAAYTELLNRKERK